MGMKPEPIRFETPTDQEFSTIRQLIREFELDDRELWPFEFLAAFSGERLEGFGRIREYEGCCELCSLGVAEPQRHKGIGSCLVRELVQRARKPLFLVCIIPEFFEPLGFHITTHYPVELQQKLSYCREALSVPEEYVVMKYEHSASGHF